MTAINFQFYLGGQNEVKKHSGQSFMCDGALRILMKRVCNMERKKSWPKVKMQVN